MMPRGLRLGQADPAVFGIGEAAAGDDVVSDVRGRPEYGVPGGDAPFVPCRLDQHRMAVDVADGRPDGFCKLIADRQTHAILGAHVLGEYSAETVQTVAACMAAGMRVEQVAELQLAYPTFTEAVSMAAQKICRAIGIGGFAQAWSYLGPEE